MPDYDFKRLVLAALGMILRYIAMNERPTRLDIAGWDADMMHFYLDKERWMKASED